MRAFRLMTVSVAALAAPGCSSEPFQVAPVSGQVTLDGKPLAHAHVNFKPIAADTLNPGPGSYGQTDDRGQYTLTVVGLSRGGAVVGKHRVMITAPEGPPPDPASDKPYGSQG